MNPAGRPSVATAPTSSRWRVRYNKVMRVVRRTHLYAGLFLTPWVFLYGVSAFLLNHQDRVSGEVVGISGAASGETPAIPTLNPADAAAGVVEALNRLQAEARGDDPGGEAPAPFRLVEPERAEFNRELMATVKAADGSYLARIDMEGGDGTLRLLPKREVPPSPFGPRPSVKLPIAPFEPVLKALPEALKARGVAAEAASLRVAPDLKFLMEGEGGVWRVTYNAQTGFATGRPAASASPAPAFYRYLILLHVAHGFPSKVNARWVWAVFVDLMFLAMAGWGATGLLMWWQMKNLRRVGLVVLLLSGVVAALLALGMHDAFVAEGLS